MKNLTSSLEVLELRLAPAGLVNLTTVNGVLTISGTNDSNDILITETAPGEWSVRESAAGATTFSLNGAAAVPNLVLPAQNSIRVNLLGGAVDALQFNNLKLGGDVVITGGDGREQVSFFNLHVSGKVTFDGGNGDDNLNVDTASNFGGAVSLKGGAGADTFNLYGSTYGAGMNVDLGAGSNTFGLMGNATVHGHLAISASGTLADSQSVNIGGTGSVGGNVTIKSTSSPLNVGLSNLAGDNLRIGGGLTIQGSSGSDLIVISNHLFVGGAFTVNVGNGGSFLNHTGGTLTAGSFKFTGGTGNDWLQFVGASFATGAGMNVNLGTGVSNRLDLSCSASVKIVGGLTLVGGTGEDNLIVTTPLLNIAGPLSFNAAAGTNSMTFRPVTGTVGAISYTGGAGSDVIDIGDYSTGSVTQITVSQGITASLGAGENILDIRDTVVQGAMRATSSSVMGLLERVRINEATILGVLDVNLSGAAASTVMVDDSTVYGATVINTGAGNDVIQFENLVPGARLTTFVGSVRILMGNDVDFFSAGVNPFAPNQGVNFLGTLLIDGGLGGDAALFQLGYGNAFAVPATTPGVETVS